MCEEYVESERALYHFHFTSKQLYEDFLELTVTTLYDNLQLLEEMLISKFPNDAGEIENQITALSDLYISKCKVPLEKFRDTAREIFTLPANIVLPGFVEEKLVTPEELEQLKAEVAELEQKYIEEIYYRAELKKEAKKFEHIQPLFKKIEEILQFCKDHKARSGTKTVKELLDVLKDCVKYYHNKKYNDEDKSDVVDEFGLFTE